MSIKEQHNHFRKRQKKIFEKLTNGSLMILLANPISYRNSDSQYKYRQNSDILYLCGFEEQDSTLILLKDIENKCKTILFVQPRDPEKEQWNGKRLDFEEVEKIYACDEACSNDKFQEWLEEAFKNNYTLHFPFATNKHFEDILWEMYNTNRRNQMKYYLGIQQYVDSAILLSELRIVKDDIEIELLRKACNISALAHIESMKATIPNMYEYEIENCLTSYFKKTGCTEAYNAIVGSGKNATILHYTNNSERCREGDLLLIDAGAEYKYYGGDITRTIPISGKFSEPQKQIYSIVLNAQKLAIEQCKSGETLQGIHQTALRELSSGLIELGILNSKINQVLTDEEYKPYYMHNTCHWLGLDTHDIGFKKIPTLEGNKLEDRKLMPGMVFTVEPGLYFSPHLNEIPQTYLGIGIRIEDDILITESGHEVLTKGVPKEIDEIEKIMNK